MGSRIAAGQDRAVRRLDRNHFQRRFAGFKHFTAAGDRAARADPADHRIDSAVGIAPNLFRGRPPMHVRVCRILELLRHDRALDLTEQFVGFGDCTFHAFGALGQNDLGAEKAQHAAALDRHGLRHGQDESVAL